MTVAVVAKLTHEWRFFMDYKDQRKPGPITFSNPELKDETLPLVALNSPHSIIVFSVPDTLERQIATNAMRHALEACAELSKAWKVPAGHVALSYRVYLAEPRFLIVAERLVRYRPRKYRGSQKFSHAFKPQIIGTDEEEIRRIPLRAT